MIKQKPELFLNKNPEQFDEIYQSHHQLLIKLLDTPIKDTMHVGSTALKGALTSGIVDIIVIVDNLHHITSLDEKRLNQQQIYRLHHPYEKKCVFSKYEDMKSLKEAVRYHIMEADSSKLKKYRDGHQLFSDMKEIEHFNLFKLSLEETLTKKDYEEEKSWWFAQKLSFA